MAGSLACTSPEAESGSQAAAELPAADAGLVAGKALFAQRCAVCHGTDGRKGLNGAHDLTKSNLNAFGRVYMITNGLGQMPSFKAQLTPAEIEQVAAYSLTLR
ncbi:c-type cytochrome [Hymenobacter daecheongensis]|uniref:c-type cytochrome n=1 Tax=Hymenobacter daecheongensis TaxID=496053 RepID=UPI0009352706|nr:cytochrome c [Hymenobacter daecheongensis]